MDGQTDLDQMDLAGAFGCLLGWFICGYLTKLRRDLAGKHGRDVWTFECLNVLLFVGFECLSLTNTYKHWFNSLETGLFCVWTFLSINLFYWTFLRIFNFMEITPFFFFFNGIPIFFVFSSRHPTFWHIWLDLQQKKSIGRSSSSINKFKKLTSKSASFRMCFKY